MVLMLNPDVSLEIRKETLDNINMVTNYNDTDFELYLIIINNEQISLSPNDVEMYVDIKGGQLSINEDGKKFEFINPLKPCDRLNSNTHDALTVDIESKIFEERPYYIDKKYNYTIQGHDKAKVNK